MDFDAQKWLFDFNKSKTLMNVDAIKDLRSFIFQNTIEVVKQGGYWGNKNVFISLFNPKNDETVFFEKPDPLNFYLPQMDTQIEVQNEDCLIVAQQLLMDGLKVCVLNMANRQNPGGGVYSGAGAQEENLFRRTNLFKSLYQFVDYGKNYQVFRNQNYSYPLNRISGGVLSENITVFRNTEEEGYEFLQNPFVISIVTVPAINQPPLIFNGEMWYLKENMIEPTKEKIRTIFRIVGFSDCNGIVLGAFGCGAFRNPPHHMAQLFKEVLEEKEFKQVFRKIVFAIKEDHNSGKVHNPLGNLKPFERIFNLHS